jgi:hypothetical protein
MKHSQWKNSHDKKQARGGLRTNLSAGHKKKAPPTRKSEWLFDVFWGEYAKPIGLSKVQMTIDTRESTMNQLNVGPLHLTVEKLTKAERYG